ncbi:MAG: lactate racemase domain-containing protein [Spirochaetaceae bacterium]|jgi:nickel-dependent lactate racemase|nr:lactate racemase domain-containing protein [Spirochaetaceae bacterium]
MEDITYTAESSTIGFLDCELETMLNCALDKASAVCGKGKVLLIPPDITRIHSRAGFLTDICYKYFGKKIKAVLPALGTHQMLSRDQITTMFKTVPVELFCKHDWRKDVVELARIESEQVNRITEGGVNYSWPCSVNKMLLDPEISLVISLGQVVPHEVAGMSNHAKNIFVGCGGKEAIDKSHYAGAVYGIDNIIGKTENPVRALFDEALHLTQQKMPPVLWVLSVVNESVRGLFTGFGRDCFTRAAKLSHELNITVLEKQPDKIVVYLPPCEYKSTWLGNKAIYRTRSAIANGGELIIAAPALECFGEDSGLDSIIRKFGYRKSEIITGFVESSQRLKDNLAVAAHLIHGSSEDRFTIRYCTGNGLSRGEIESAGFKWGSLDKIMERYDLEKSIAGWNKTKDGEEFYFISNPALGLWRYS